MNKKSLILLIVVFTTISFSYGQQAFNRNDQAVNLGLGFGWRYHPKNNFAPMPSFNIAYEAGVYEFPGVGVITAGGLLEYRHTRYEDKGDIYYWNSTAVTVRGAFHLGMLNTSKFDIYGGFMMGPIFNSYHNTDLADDDWGYNRAYYVFDAFLGGRIMMSDKFGIFTEMGYGISYLKLGATFKF
ncbi:MAG: hypothetical protein U9N85_06470 [Bacteroidota bacterium]|nr:hypothetical protein [Bacteroidota bacterium]